MAAMQGFLKLLACSRRQQIITVSEEDAKPEKVISPKSEAASDSESTRMSTEPGDLSNNELSDHSENLSGSTDVSDNEVLVRDFKPVGPPPGLSLMSPPPGLDDPADFAPMQNSQGSQRLGTRLSSQAALFVPSFGATAMPLAVKPERQTISLVKGVLEEWEAALPDENQYQQQQQCCDSKALRALQETVSRLSPQEAAVLRSVLNSKEAEQKEAMASWAVPAMQTAASGAFPPGMQDTIYPVPAMQYQPLAAVGPMLVPPGTFSCYNPSPMQAQTRLGEKSRQPIKSSMQDEEKNQSTGDDQKDTLRTNLRDLSAADPDKVLMVRKINRLGLDSANLLESYFSKFGVVQRALVSHSRAKSLFGKGAARVRPAGLGFMIMTSPEEVQAALAAGTEHEIAGVTISVFPFESRPMPMEEGAAEAADAPPGL